MRRFHADWIAFGVALVLSAGVQGQESAKAVGLSPGKSIAGKPFPRSESLTVIMAWLDREYERLALEGLARVWRAPDAMCVVIDGSPRAEVLPLDEWKRLIDRCEEGLRSNKSSRQLEAIAFLCSIDQLVRSNESIRRAILPSMIDAIGECGSSADSSVRWQGVSILIGAGLQRTTSPQRTVPIFLRAARDIDPTVRLTGVNGLTTLMLTVPDDFPPSKEMVDALLPLLDDPDRRLKVFSIEALGHTREAGQVAVPRLQIIVMDDHSGLRRLAKEALKSLSSFAPGAMDRMRNMLRPGEEASLTGGVRSLREMRRAESRAAVLWSMVKMRRAASPAVPELIALLDSPMRSDVTGSLDVLWEIGPGATEALPRLSRMKLEEPEEERGRVQGVIDRISVVPEVGTGK